MLVPVFVIVRLRITDFSGSGNVLLLLQNSISTVPFCAGLLFLPPLNIKFEAFSARSDFAESLPSTKHNASPTLLLPDPFGPRMQLYLSSKGISVL